MFDVLVLSGAHLELRSRWVGTSLLMHVSVAALAVMVTRAALESPSFSQDIALRMRAAR